MSEPRSAGAGGTGKAGESPLSDEELLTSIAQRIVRMQLTAPAIFFLESSKPLSYVGSQTLVFFEPFVKAFLNVANYDRFVALLEDRQNVERLLLRIEDLDQESQQLERTRRGEERAARRATDGRLGSRSLWSKLSRPWTRRQSSPGVTGGREGVRNGDDER